MIDDLLTQVDGKALIYKLLSTVKSFTRIIKTKYASFQSILGPNSQFITTMNIHSTDTSTLVSYLLKDEVKLLLKEFNLPFKSTLKVSLFIVTLSLSIQHLSLHYHYLFTIYHYNMIICSTFIITLSLSIQYSSLQYHYPFNIHHYNIIIHSTFNRYQIFNSYFHII